MNLSIREPKGLNKEILEAGYGITTINQIEISGISDITECLDLIKAFVKAGFKINLSGSDSFAWNSKFDFHVHYHYEDGDKLEAMSFYRDLFTRIHGNYDKELIERKPEPNFAKSVFDFFQNYKSDMDATICLSVWRDAERIMSESARKYKSLETEFLEFHGSVYDIFQGRYDGLCRIERNLSLSPSYQGFFILKPKGTRRSYVMDPVELILADIKNVNGGKIKKYE